MEDIFKKLGKIVKVEQGINITLKWEEIQAIYDVISIIDNNELFDTNTKQTLNKLSTKIKSELYLKRMK